MKRWIIIIIEIALVFAFFNSSMGQYLLGDAHEEVAGWMEKAANYAEYEQLSILREGLQPHLVGLNEAQQSYMDELTKNKHRIRQFSASYCQGDDINPYVYGEILQVVCSHFVNNKYLFPARHAASG